MDQQGDFAKVKETNLAAKLENVFFAYERCVYMYMYYNVRI